MESKALLVVFWAFASGFIETLRCGLTREYHPVAANNGEAYLLHLNNAIWRTIQRILNQRFFAADLINSQF